MKIGIDCRELGAYQTGIGRILIEFLREARRKAKDFEFILFGNEKTDFLSFQDIILDYRRVVIKERWTFWWDQIQLKKALQKNEIDVFFSPYYKIPLLTRAKTVLSIFDLTYLLVEPYAGHLKNTIYVKNFIKLAARKAKKIITCSNSTKEDLSEILHLPQGKINVVHLGISSRFRTIHEKNRIESAKKKYGIPRKYVLYVGNFSPHKNLKRLVRAYHLLTDHLKEEYSLVLGGGEAEKLGIRDAGSLICISHIAEEDLPTLYSGAELFVFPSLYEGFGFPPLEAMACGCPVASSNTSSLPEVLGEAALFFDPCRIEEISSAIRRMIEDEDLRNRLRQKGLERARLFTPEKMTGELLSVFESVYGN
jgi:glycosyltransferase involved in cell wall biosynthesis